MQAVYFCICYAQHFDRAVFFGNFRSMISEKVSGSQMAAEERRRFGPVFAFMGFLRISGRFHADYCGIPLCRL